MTGFILTLAGVVAAFALAFVLACRTSKISLREGWDILTGRDA